jgi:16S rRNA (cytosine967-C5)-methyltransferase
LTGVERDPQQLTKAQDNALRLGHKGITWWEGDFANFQPLISPVKILLDAPCTGLGVLRRHPEGKWLKKPDMINVYQKQQQALLAHAWSLLPPGGELIYAVCSFEPEESLAHLAWIESQEGQIQPLAGRIPDYYQRYITKEHVLLVYAGAKDLVDGFAAFVARKLS